MCCICFARDLTETPTPVVQALPKDKQALLRHLEKTTPESLALARDWEDVAWNIVKTQQKLEKYASVPMYPHAQSNHCLR